MLQKWRFSRPLLAHSGWFSLAPSAHEAVCNVVLPLLGPGQRQDGPNGLKCMAGSQAASPTARQQQQQQKQQHARIVDVVVAVIVTVYFDAAIANVDVVYHVCKTYPVDLALRACIPLAWNQVVQSVNESLPATVEVDPSCCSICSDSSAVLLRSRLARVPRAASRARSGSQQNARLAWDQCDSPRIDPEERYVCCIAYSAARTSRRGVERPVCCCC